MRAMNVNARALFTAAAGLLAVLSGAAVHADPAPFDLAGPSLQVKVSRGGQTLPIAEVPNLAAGDQLSIRADLPTTQSAHYLLIAAFLRGATNPPPKNWFFQCETWTRQCAQVGLSLTVPAEAQQVLLFLAPETGGDFRTVVGAVRGRPGAFVRASQDLNQATLDRSRLDAHLAAIRALSASDPAKLKDVAPLLARSLAIKVDAKCFDKIPELQAPCLMAGQDSLILNDGHSTSIVEALTSGPASDLAMEASYTPQLSYGFYSPYIASVLDIARILDSFHTARYQYIPALSSLQAAELALTLNTPPSFRDPKSVLVIALPAVERAQLPPLHAVDPKEIYCARKDTLVLPVEGAPLVFSTDYAHQVTLRLSGKDGKTFDLPAQADAEQGGFVVNTATLATASLGDRITGALQGFWGFEKYSGPTFELVNAHTQDWSLAGADDGALVVGREDTVHLEAGSVSCVDRVMFQDADGKELKVDWKTVKPNEVEIKLPLQEAKPGPITLLVAQHGGGQPQHVSLHAFSEAAHLEHFTLYAGEDHGVLQGSRLDEVASLALQNVVFLPGKLTTGQGKDELAMVAQDPGTAGALLHGDSTKAKVMLKDGRALTLAVAVNAPRPNATLIGKSVQPSVSSSASNIQLADPDELPQDARLTFSLRSQSSAGFTHDDKVEVGTVDGSSTTTLSVSNGGIMLEDARVAVATLDPSKAFGTSTFGPLQFRVVSGDAAGDWHPLATLVRLPVLRELKCPATAELACRLSGSNLFLVEAVSNDSRFAHPVQVPDGFPGYALPVPHPTDGPLYVKLRDYPSVVNATALRAESLPPTPDEASRAEVRHAAQSTPDNTPVPAPTSAPPAAPAPAAPTAPVPTTVASPALPATAVTTPAHASPAAASPAPAPAGPAYASPAATPPGQAVATPAATWPAAASPPALATHAPASPAPAPAGPAYASPAATPPGQAVATPAATWPAAASPPALATHAPASSAPTPATPAHASPAAASPALASPSAAPPSPATALTAPAPASPTVTSPGAPATPATSPVTATIALAPASEGAAAPAPAAAKMAAAAPASAATESTPN